MSRFHLVPTDHAPLRHSAFGGSGLRIGNRLDARHCIEAPVGRRCLTLVGICRGFMGKSTGTPVIDGYNPGFLYIFP